MATTNDKDTPARAPGLMRVTCFDPLILAEGVDVFALRQHVPLAVYDFTTQEVVHVSFLGEGLRDAFAQVLPDPSVVELNPEYGSRLHPQVLGDIIRYFPDLWPWASLWIVPADYVRYMKRLEDTRGDEDPGLLQGVRDDLIKRLRTSGEALDWATAFKEDRDRVKHLITESEDALHWMIRFRDDAAEMAAYINQDSHAYQFANLNRGHRHLVRHHVRESRTALNWAKGYPEDRDVMRPLVVKEVDVFDWVQRFPEDRCLMRDRIHSSYFAFQWALHFPEDYHRMIRLVVESEVATWWAGEFPKDREYMLPLVTRAEDAYDWLQAWPQDWGRLVEGVVMRAGNPSAVAEAALNWVIHNRKGTEERGDLGFFLQKQKTPEDWACWIEVFPEDTGYFAEDATVGELEFLYDMANYPAREALRDYLPLGHPYREDVDRDPLGFYR